MHDSGNTLFILKSFYRSKILCALHLWLLVWNCMHTTAPVKQEAPHVLTWVSSWHFRYITGKPNEPKGISPAAWQFVRQLEQNTNKTHIKLPSLWSCDVNTASMSTTTRRGVQFVNCNATMNSTLHRVVIQPDILLNLPWPYLDIRAKSLRPSV